VYFANSLQCLNNQVRRKTTKTAKGRRRVPITRATAEALLAHREARGGALTDYVFPSPQGGPLRAKNWEERETCGTPAPPCCCWPTSTPRWCRRGWGMLR
jgi:integrase